ncbi:MAG: hypothetical protein JY451_15590 [Erythrobacter sp.]|nr:MAG: hypothetical protein JY451_15590 [Erythrobacter sp.]
MIGSAEGHRPPLTKLRIGVAVCALIVIGCFLAANALSSGPAEAAGSSTQTVLSPDGAGAH